MTTYIPAKKGAELIFYIGLVSQSTGQFQVNPTIAAGDFKVSIDGGALANLATLPAVTPAASKMVKVTLSTSEMNGDNITVVGSDAAGAEWDDVIINIQTAAQQIDDLATSAALATVQSDTNDIQTRLPAALTGDGLIKADTLRVGGTLQTAGDIIGDTNDIQTRLPAALSGDGFIKADLLSIGDELISGNNATLKLKKLDIRNTANSDYAVYIQSSGDTGAGVVIEGIGENGAGVSINGDLAGTYLFSNKDGIVVEHGGDGTGNFHGLKFINDSVDGGKSISAPSDIAVSDGNLTLAAIAAAVWALVIETGYTAKNSMRLMLSALAGKISGAATTTVVIRDVNDSKDRITATVDASGNRTSVTKDVS